MKRLAVLFMVALAAPRLAVADAVADPPPDPGPTGEPGVRAHAVRRNADITIDGHIDDAGWKDVPSSGGFIQRQPEEGKAPSQQTEFQVAYDDKYVYVAIRAWDSDPKEIRALLTRRDQDSMSDWLMVGFDSYHDRRTAYVFGLNAAGVQRDGIIYDDTVQDFTWDAVWSGAVNIDDKGWTAEMRIPLSQLRFSGKPDQDWGFQIVRLIPDKGEMSSWSVWPRSSQNVVSFFGTLDDIKGLTPKARLELLPYASTGVQLQHADDPMDPFTKSADGRYNGGLDVKYGLGSAFTLAATINPDFGQVEADPSQVNLSGQELFFAEKRPFFLEGTDLFQWGFGQGGGPSGEGLFYSRRIGAPPHLYGTDYANYAKQPDDTTIYGAAKITGKTESGWSVGVLEAVTAQATAQLDTGKDLVVEPLTNYGVLRVKKDLRQGMSTIAGIFSAVDRKLDAPEVKANLHDQAYTGGFDGSHRFGKDNEWEADGKLYGSFVHGSTDAILADQTNLIRLYQRPDATDVHLDPMRTSLSGGGFLWDVGRWNNEKFNYGVGGDIRTPGLELNDIGFQTQADGITQWFWTGWNHNDPGANILSWNSNVNGWAFSDFEPLLEGAGLSTNTNVTLTNYWNFYAGANLNYGRWNPQLLRGGPRYHAENGLGLNAGFGTDSRKPVYANVNFGFNRRGQSDSFSSNVSADITVQARSNIDVGIGPALQINDEAHQYVDTEPDTMGDPRYLFARLHEVVTAMTVRASWTFSPRLSLQFYAQPFIASGAYSEYKEPNQLRASSYADRWTFLSWRQAHPEADGLIHVDKDGDGVDDYVTGKPDFDFRQMNVNMVMRWEYRPGSTIFLIWSHERDNEEDTDGMYRFGHDLSALAKERGEHIVMVKANYWFGL